MHAKLKWLHSPDVPDLASYVPIEQHKFGFLLQLIVGPHDGPGEESFDVVVCTASWLTERYAGTGFVSLRHHILVEEYRYAELEQFLRKLVETVDGASWDEIAAKVSRVGHWEFEDYRDA